MHILIVAQHFPPEKGAVRRLFEFARIFVQEGHKVSVLTAIPNYPDGIVPEKYRGHFSFYEQIDGVDVYRSWVLPASNRYPIKRMIGFILFLFTALINARKIPGKVDVVLASTPPPTIPLIGWILSRWKRATYVIEIRDLQPESSESFGNLRPSLFTRSLKGMMHWFYRQADWVVAVTDGIASTLQKTPRPPKNILTIKSGFSSEFFDADMNGIRKTYGWEEKFIVCRAGTLGWAHHLEPIIEAARRMVRYPDIQFVFVGDGEKTKLLEEMVRDYGLKNVTFTGPQPLESIPHFLKASDVLIESLREVPLTEGTFPAKLFEYMAVGRPIVFGSRSGEAINELNVAGGALSFAVDDIDKLCELILKLRNGEIDGNALGEKYRAHADRHHHRHIWADRYLDLFDNLSGTRRVRQPRPETKQEPARETVGSSN
jgi:glycosyltransferase involved in cell wall biosynthesis